MLYFILLAHLFSMTPYVVCIFDLIPQVRKPLKENSLPHIFSSITSSTFDRVIAISDDHPYIKTKDCGSGQKIEIPFFKFWSRGYWVHHIPLKKECIISIFGDKRDQNFAFWGKGISVDKNGRIVVRRMKRKCGNGKWSSILC